ncbi:GNAT family N-acetyltransferase [Candidatus Cloacimonadota bacterium]
MSILNIEIKAKCSDPTEIRNLLLGRNAEFKGTDHQIDTYFKSRNGRYKMREGNIEYSLVFYDREDIAGPKKSDVIYYHPRKTDLVKQQLSKALGELVVVDKQREIYFIDNVKFHLDTVHKLGSFVEIEAIDRTGEIGAEKLYEQCREYLDLFKIPEKNLLKNSYSDILMNKEMSVREGTIEEIVKLSLQIPEFTDPYSHKNYQKRLSNKRSLILIAEYKMKPAGFKVGYENEDHFYSWMGGVLPEFRKQGVATKLADYQENWCRKKGLKKVNIKIRNQHRNMLLFSLSRGFMITGFDEKPEVMESRILLEKKL